MTWISELHSIVVKAPKSWSERSPKRFILQKQLEQSYEIMRLGWRQRSFFKPRLKVFFRALLTMETDAICSRFRPAPHQGGRYLEIFFRATDPLTRRALHTLAFLP